MKAYEEEECLNDATVQWNKMKMANIIIQCIQLWFNAVHSLFLANFYFILCFGWNAIYSTKFDFIFALGWCSRGSSCCTSFDGHLPFRKVHFGKSIYFVPLILFSRHNRRQHSIFRCCQVCVCYYCRCSLFLRWIQCRLCRPSNTKFS